MAPHFNYIEIKLNINMAWNDLSMSDKSRMMRLAINSGITDLRTIRDVYNSYAEGGLLHSYKEGGNKMKNFVRRIVDSEARKAQSYSSKQYSFEDAYKDARSKGQRTFFWDGKYYNTDYEGTHGRQYKEDVASGKAAAFEAAYPGFANPELRKEKQEELDTYGITNEQTQNKNIVSQRLLNNIDPYGDYDLAQAIDAVILNHKQRKTDYISQANNETHIAQLRNYLGYPAEPVKLTTPEGAPVKISKYTPMVGNSQEGKYYYTFKRNPFGYQPQNPEKYLDEYERLKSVGDKYLSGQFYEDALKYGLDYATKIADENLQAWSDYYDNHRDEIKGYGPLEPAFKITQETGSKEQRRSYGNAGGLGNFAVYNNPTYSSFYDLWDIGIGQGNNTNTFGIGKPFEYYDRHYHNPAEEPDIDKLYTEFSTGGKIHIKPENRGKFTELKRRTGHSASWFKENGTPAQRKMATFALNARKWHHADGGYLFEEGGDTTEQIPQEEMTSQSRPSFGERIKNLNKKLWESVPATSGLTFPLAALSSGLYGGAQVMNKLLSSRDRESLGTVREIPQEPQYKSYFDATPEELEKAQIYLPKENGEWNTSSVGNYGDKHYDVLESRARGLMSAMRRAEFTQPEINRLSPFLLTQLILEGGWVLSRDDNNYGGMLDANEDHIVFDSEDSFYDSYLKNLDKRWGDEVMGEGKGWRNASTLQEYTDIINREDLGLHTKEAYNNYIRKHPKDSVSIYTPWWQNGDKSLMDHMKGIAPRARGLYWLLRQRMDAWDELAKNNNIVK